ncbi:MAG: hypothetical protein KGL39_57275 [Patescibacteria group bacterium]|nr:hypothetical protein [Patescibacteria group bacterium]
MKERFEDMLRIDTSTEAVRALITEMWSCFKPGDGDGRSLLAKRGIACLETVLKERDLARDDAERNLAFHDAVEMRASHAERIAEALEQYILRQYEGDDVNYVGDEIEKVKRGVVS